MTQVDLASAIGVSFQQIQKYETGLSAIPRRRLQRICDTLMVPLNFFVSEKVELGERQFLASGEGQSLVKAFMGIDRRLRTHILEFIISVADDRQLR